MAYAHIYLPDGYGALLPVDPTTWVDQAPGVAGSPLRAPILEQDAGAAVAWHRQRALFQGVQVNAQSIPASTWTAVTGLQELIDNYGGHSDSSNTDRWYAPTTSSANDWYLCSGYVPFSSSDGAKVHIAGLRKTGSGTISEGGKITSGTGHIVDTMALDLVQMGAGDYVSLMAWQNTGAAVNTVVSNKNPSLTVRWVCMDPAAAGAYTPAVPAAPHTWVDSDRATADATGTVSGHELVPLNRELRDVVRFLNNPPICRLTSQGTTQTIPSGASWTSIAMTAESVDNYGGHDLVTNNSRYTCQRAGLYLAAGYVSVGESGGANTGYRASRLLVNGTTPYGGMTTVPQSSGGTGTGLYAVGLLRLAVGDYVEVQMQQTQGAALSVNSGAGNASRLIAVWKAS